MTVIKKIRQIQNGKVAAIKSINKLQTSLTPRKRFHASIYFSPTYVNAHINKGDDDSEDEKWKH